MKKQESLKAYLLLIEKVKLNRYPSKQELLDFLRYHGFNVSARTFERYKQELKDDFGVNIAYSRYKDGYYLSYEFNDDELDAFLKLLEVFSAANVILESLKDGKKALEYIKFESYGEFSGITHLHKILQAVKKRRPIQFVHVNFHRNTEKNYLIHPYLLREYQNRWYVIGYVPGLEDFRTFGLDRIKDLQVLDTFFSPEKQKKAQELFDNTIGVVYDNEELEEIVLSFTPTQGKYIKTLPFHHTQEVVADNDKEFRIRFMVYPNYELKQKILMHLDTVTVVKPEWLAQEIKNIAQKIVRKYS